LIIKTALLLIGLSLLILLSADLLQRLSVPGFPELITVLGMISLLSGFGLLVGNALLGIVKQTFFSTCHYFSAKERWLRRNFFIEAKQEQLKQLAYFKTLKVRYINTLKKQRLSKANDQKHIRQLSTAIAHDLKSLKKKLPKTTYLELQKENHQHRNQLDAEALLRLQQKITALVETCL
jgi:hypothetical protein